METDRARFAVGKPRRRASQASLLKLACPDDAATPAHGRRSSAQLYQAPCCSPAKDPPFRRSREPRRAAPATGRSSSWWLVGCQSWSRGGWDSRPAGTVYLYCWTNIRLMD
ncbi:hypothetical protein PVAP13_2KG507500 [Panicum virgatum]|uniref:Uncharacterized protein n=1 Tax=Panicum virgatum TaxID=38727 RepID=A0A8T0WKV8_PANVG|nr:hypothetical protein PVAP13_2KG507500 [Panicum virgatum]